MWTRGKEIIEELEWQIPRDGLEGPYWFAVKGDGYEFYIRRICGLTYRINAGQGGARIHHYAPMCGWEAHVVLKGLGAGIRDERTDKGKEESG